MTPESDGDSSDWILNTTGLCSSRTNPNATGELTLPWKPGHPSPHLNMSHQAPRRRAWLKRHFRRQNRFCCGWPTRTTHALHKEVREYLPSPRKKLWRAFWWCSSLWSSGFLQKRKLRRQSATEILKIDCSFSTLSSQSTNQKKQRRKIKEFKLTSLIRFLVLLLINLPGPYKD